MPYYESDGLPADASNWWLLIVIAVGKDALDIVAAQRQHLWKLFFPGPQDLFCHFTILAFFQSNPFRRAKKYSACLRQTLMDQLDFE